MSASAPSIATLAGPGYEVVLVTRVFPSANMVLVRAPRPLLIDTGFGSQYAETEHLLAAAGVPAERLTLVANTHYHCDHVGGNAALQQRYQVPIAASRQDAHMINTRDREACSAVWLNQPVEAYTVSMALDDGATIDTGAAPVRVVATPGHTLGHLCFVVGDVLIAGDALHSDDVAWLNIFREGAGALTRAMLSLEVLLGLPVRVMVSGHSGVTHDARGHIRAALDRYGRWASAPQRVGWHACKRIFSYALMLNHGVAHDEVSAFLGAQPWFNDFARHVFDSEPSAFVGPLVNEMLRSGALVLRDGRLFPTARYVPPAPGWAHGATVPGRWPRVAAG